MKQHRQLVLVVCETSSSFTCSCLIDNKRSWSLLAGLLRFCLELRPLARPQSVARVDPAPGVSSLSNDEFPRQNGITKEVGKIKNPNKISIAEKCIAELGDELLRIRPGGASPLFPWLSLLLTSTSPSTTDSYQLVKCGSNVISSPIRVCLIFI